MRTTSSFKFVGVLLGPLNMFPDVGAGKMPAFRSAAELGSIMHDGMVLVGNGDPCTTPAGRTPPGQFLASTAGDTCEAEGTLIVVAPKLPPYVAGSGTGVPAVMLP